MPIAAKIPSTLRRMTNPPAAAAKTGVPKGALRPCRKKPQPEVIPLIELMEFPQPEGRARRAPRPRPAAPTSQTEPLQEGVQDRGGGCYIKDIRGGGKMDDKTRTELEAATFRALVAHLRERTDVQNIDLTQLPVEMVSRRGRGEGRRAQRSRGARDRLRHAL